MSLILTDSSNYTAIANAIRTKNGTNTTYTPAEMSTAITNLKFDWMGENPEHVKKVYTLSTTLDKTSYPSWTPSTTATKMVSAATVSATESLDLTLYDYVMVWFSDCNVAYTSSWSASTASCVRETCMYTQAVFKRPASVTSATGESYDYTASQENAFHIFYCKYYSNASTISLANTTYSPCYIYGITAPTFSSTSSNTPTMTIKTPTLYARCSATYFSTANAALVDQANTTVKMEGHLYRVKAGTCVSRQTWEDLVYVFNHPL